MDSRNLTLEQALYIVEGAFAPADKTHDAITVILDHANDCEPYLKRLRAGVDQTCVMLQDPHKNITDIDDFFNAISDEFMVLKDLMKERNTKNLTHFPSIDHLDEIKNKMIVMKNTIDRRSDELVKKEVQKSRDEFSNAIANHFKHLAKISPGKIKLSELGSALAHLSNQQKQGALPKIPVPENPKAVEELAKDMLFKLKRIISYNIESIDWTKAQHARLTTGLPNQKARYEGLQQELTQVNNIIIIRLELEPEKNSPPPSLPTLNIGQLYYHNNGSVDPLAQQVASLKIR